MTNEELIKAQAIMCSKYNCIRCPMGFKNNGCKMLCEEFRIKYSKKALKFIEEWWEKNK